MRTILVLLLVCSLLPQVPCKRRRCYHCNDSNGGCGTEAAKVTVKTCPRKSMFCSANEEKHNGVVNARFYGCFKKRKAECLVVPNLLFGVMVNASLCFNVCSTDLCNKVIPIDNGTIANQTTAASSYQASTTTMRSESTAMAAAYTEASTWTTQPMLGQHNNITATTPSGSSGRNTVQLWLAFFSMFAALLAN